MLCLRQDGIKDILVPKLNSVRRPAGSSTLKWQSLYQGALWPPDIGR